MWIDTHCHLDAPEFDTDRDAVVERARTAGVGLLVLPAVLPAHFDAVRTLAHRHGLVYALGIHPMYVDQAPADALGQLEQALSDARDDPRLVAVGEIGLDGFVEAPDLATQRPWYLRQLALAQAFDLPVLLHVRRSADALLQGLARHPVRGIAHAFNGSAQQAARFVDLGFKLGFGGAMTFERALRIRALARDLPEHAIVLETDAPDIPPQWLYRTAQERAQGVTSRNEPQQLPRIARELAALRGCSLAHVQRFTADNARQALPRLAAWAHDPAGMHSVGGSA